MLNNKEFRQAEELSECLDAFNNDSQPITEDEEIKELVEMANLVKQSYHQEAVPQLLIDELVDNIAAELKAQKQQKGYKHWLYGGLIGTAAAVLIAAFLQFLVPQSVENNIAQQIDDSTVAQKNVAVADQGGVPINSQITNTMIGQQAQLANSTEAPLGQAVEKKATEDLSAVIVEIMQVVKSPETDIKPSQVAMLQKETPKEMPMRRSVFMAAPEINSLQEDKPSQLTGKTSMMVLPNQTAQSITVDNNSGTIRQVYNQGTSDEIIITQNLLVESRVKTRDDAKQGAVKMVAESRGIQPVYKETKDHMNSLTVKVDKYSIMIEGQKTDEELGKIIQSLTMKDIEQ